MVQLVELQLCPAIIVILTLFKSVVNIQEAYQPAAVLLPAHQHSIFHILVQSNVRCSWFQVYSKVRTVWGGVTFHHSYFTQLWYSHVVYIG